MSIFSNSVSIKDSKTTRKKLNEQEHSNTFVTQLSHRMRKNDSKDSLRGKSNRVKKVLRAVSLDVPIMNKQESGKSKFVKTKLAPRLFKSINKIIEEKKIQAFIQ